MGRDEISTSNDAPLHLSLPSPTLRRLAEEWLREDAPSFDAGAIAAGSHPASASLYAKSSLVVAGRPFFDAVFASLNCSVEWLVSEGTQFTITEQKVQLAVVTGPANSILLGERCALNALAECCSVAQAAHRAAELATAVQWAGRVAGTRKTTPGLRLLQKYAMAVGGMDTHRVDLSSMVMLKDNHIAAAGDVNKAVRDVRKVAGFSMKIEVECENLEEATRACEAGADVVMLDNFESVEFKETASRVKEQWPNILVEASGGINFETMQGFMCPSSDVISFSVNRYAKPVDLSLKIRPKD